MSKRKTSAWEDEATSGVRLAVGILLSVTWVGITAGGAAIAFSDTEHSRLTGWVILIVAASVAILTMNTWAKALPMVLGGAIFGGFISIWKGYGGNDPSLRIPTRTGFIMLVLLVACNAVAIPLSSRRLTTFDKVALSAFLVSFFVAFAEFPSMWGFVLMFCSLAATWIHNRIGKLQNR